MVQTHLQLSKSLTQIKTHIVKCTTIFYKFSTLETKVKKRGDGTREVWYDICWGEAYITNVFARGYVLIAPLFAEVEFKAVLFYIFLILQSPEANKRRDLKAESFLGYVIASFTLYLGPRFRWSQDRVNDYSNA